MYIDLVVGRDEGIRRRDDFELQMGTVCFAGLYFDRIAPTCCDGIHIYQALSMAYIARLFCYYILHPDWYFLAQRWY